MTNPYTLLAALVLLVSALLGSYGYGNHVGSLATETKWQKREAQIAESTAALLKSANDRVKLAEQKSAQDAAAISAKYQAKLKETEHEKNVAIANARAAGLFVNADCTAGGSGAVPNSSSGPVGHNGTARIRLPDQVADDLLGLASDADKLAEQLTAAQALILKDREICNGK